VKEQRKSEASENAGVKGKALGMGVVASLSEVARRVLFKYDKR